MLAVVPFLTLLAGMRYEWWEYPSPADIFLDLATVCLAILGLIVLGVIWAVRSYRYWKRNRRLTWSSAVAPLLVVATAAAFALVDGPVDRDFDRANGQMEELALSMLGDVGARLGPTEIGGVRFSTVYVGNDNCV
ncbi:hypothetical protein QMK17_26015 [Rhodococcus sp. G-MC3]|uniref:hypothetical protein n=1 Tax=Rhodococcus sp. G-MC3 TaxID=3046209 RepID=UPI0024BAD595|nr:hypothetical protein [Rhodococcus sp. G-MC3]MDJ0396748.1 hypothetical protein [Rhodococcus sp. G-MC3]